MIFDIVFENRSLPEYHWRHEANQVLLLYSLYILMPLGIIFNTVQTCVYCRKKFFKNSMSVYLITISINNILVLITTSLRFINYIEIYDYHENTEIGCRLAQFWIRLFYCGCFWLLFLLTLDRVIFILYPNNLKILQKKQMS